MHKEELLKKLNENDETIKEEKERIKKYLEDTKQKAIETLKMEDLQHEKFDESKFNQDDFVLVDQKTIDNKFNPIHDKWFSPNVLGFQKDDQEILKIQGSYCYDDRTTVDESVFKKCHFACIYSIMFAVHHPFESMNYRSVDVILENGSKIFESIDVAEYSKNMTLKGVIVDRVSYTLKMSKYVTKNIKKCKDPKKQVKLKILI